MGAAAPVIKFAQALAQWLHSASRSSQLLEQPSFPLLSAPAQVAALARLPISTVRLLTRPARRCRTSPPTHQTPQVSPTPALSLPLSLCAAFPMQLVRWNQTLPASFCQPFEAYICQPFEAYICQPVGKCLNTNTLKKENFKKYPKQQN